MHCQRCNCQMEAEEAREYAGRSICEDCYMDILSPQRPCDPWAVYTASRLAEQDSTLTPGQRAMVDLLERQGPLRPEQVMRDLGLDGDTFQRDFTALRHMTLVRGTKLPGGDTVILRYNDPDPA